MGGAQRVDAGCTPTSPALLAVRLGILIQPPCSEPALPRRHWEPALGSAAAPCFTSTALGEPECSNAAFCPIPPPLTAPVPASRIRGGDLQCCLRPLPAAPVLFPPAISDSLTRQHEQHTQHGSLQFPLCHSPPPVKRCYFKALWLSGLVTYTVWQLDTKTFAYQG